MSDDAASEPHWEADDDYSSPEIRGVPVEGEPATVRYKSRRTGEIVTRSGTVTKIRDESFGSGLHIQLCEVHIEDADGEFIVWLGGGFTEQDVEQRREGKEPAMVYTRYLQSNPGGGGVHWRENRLGHPVEVIFPAGTRLELTLEGVAPEEVNTDRIRRLVEKDVRKYRSHRKNQISVEISATELLDPAETAD